MSENITLKIDSLATDEEKANFCGQLTGEDMKNTPMSKANGRTFFCTLALGNFRNLCIIDKDKDLEFESPTKLAKYENDILAIAEENGYKVYGSFAISAKGYKHVHLVVTTGRKKTRYRAIAKEFGNCWIKDLYGRKSDAIDYVEKITDKYKEKGETIIKCFGNRAEISDNRGSRDLVFTFDELANQEGFNLYTWLLENITEENKSDWNYYCKRYDAIIMKKAKERGHVKVVYVDGGTAQGKTRGIYKKFGGMYDDDEVCRYNAESKSFPLDNYTGQKVLLIDELRPGMIKPNALLELLDPNGYDLNIDKKNSRIKANFTEVYITSAFPLEDWYESQEGLEGYENYAIMKAQFIRRISKHYTAVAGTWVEDENFEDYKQDCITYANLVTARLKKRAKIDKGIELKAKIAELQAELKK